MIEFTKRYLHENVVLQTPTFYMKMNDFDTVFCISWEEGVPVVYLSLTTGLFVSYVRKNNYLSKGKWKDTSLLHRTWGTVTDTSWKDGTWKYAEKLGQELTLIILMLSLISRSSLSSPNIGNSSLRLVSIFLLTTITCWNFEISKTSQYLNISSIQYMLKIRVSLLSVFFPWLFCRLILNF